MTLAEAKEILADHKVREALEFIITFLPADTTRPTAAERMKELRSKVMEAKGFDPFETKGKDRELVVWRSCFYYQLRKEGYTFGEIGRAANYNHATIIHNYQTLEGYLFTRDTIAVGIWNEYIKATQ